MANPADNHLDHREGEIDTGGDNGDFFDRFVAVHGGILRGIGLESNM